MVTRNDPATAVLSLHAVSVLHSGRPVVDSISLDLLPGERWVILGPNGCGKTTLLRVLSLYLHPTTGVIAFRGIPLGNFDVRSVRSRIAYSSASLGAELRPALIARDVVMTARHGALEAWWHEYDDSDRERAISCLDHLGIASLAHRPFGTLSSGEQQRVLLARTLMREPEVVLLDEPSARLDLGGRERLVSDIDALSHSASHVPLVLVTHHVDEVPTTCTHAMLMKDGSALARGSIDDAITSENVSECFEIDLIVERRANGRRTAHRR
ncbi:MAG: ATP-binding cassette domain-containing protein [Actinobacteria bacterium]|nr:ATP-binding cassette domain-containing protein [Actinomycetota bacterium]